MTLFQNKFRVESARRQGWDYADNGYYFVTICTKDKEYFFGEVVNGEMVLSEMGLVVKNEIDITQKRKNLIVEKFVIMPNHIHLLLQLFENESERRRDVAHYGTTQGSDIEFSSLRRGIQTILCPKFHRKQIQFPL